MLYSNTTLESSYLQPTSFLGFYSGKALFCNNGLVKSIPCNPSTILINGTDVLASIIDSRFYLTELPNGRSRLVSSNVNSLPTFYLIGESLTLIYSNSSIQRTNLHSIPDQASQPSQPLDLVLILSLVFSIFGFILMLIFALVCIRKRKRETQSSDSEDAEDVQNRTHQSLERLKQSITVHEIACNNPKVVVQSSHIPHFGVLNVDTSENRLSLIDASKLDKKIDGGVPKRRNSMGDLTTLIGRASALGAVAEEQSTLSRDSGTLGRMQSASPIEQTAAKSTNPFDDLTKSKAKSNPFDSSSISSSKYQLANSKPDNMNAFDAASYSSSKYHFAASKPEPNPFDSSSYSSSKFQLAKSKPDTSFDKSSYSSSKYFPSKEISANPFEMEGHQEASIDQSSYSSSRFFKPDTSFENSSYSASMKSAHSHILPSSESSYKSINETDSVKSERTVTLRKEQ